MATNQVSMPCRCTVYDGTGEPCAQSLDLEEPAEDGASSDRTSLRRIMSRDVVCARSDLRVGAVLALMIDRHVGCIPVVDDQRRPVGVITKFDIVEQLDVFVRAARSTAAEFAALTAGEMMLPIAITLGESATVATAAAMMATEDLHHVLVVNARGRLVGIVSTKDITNWLVENVPT